MTNNNIQNWIDKPFQMYHADTFPKETNEITYFALTDTLIKYAGEFNQPILYFWPTKQVIFLGMIDTKLPYLNESLQAFKDEGYTFIVRNSGGLAVVSDPGILNFSMIFPESRDRLSIDDAYERMHHLITEAFRDLDIEIEADEIPDSYCPGDYDLSINGRKIAGISQRRVSGGISIMIYISIAGDQKKRAEMIKKFYEQGLQNEEVNWHYPDVNPGVMTTLNEAAGTDLSVDDIIQRILKVVEKNQDNHTVEAGKYTDFIMDNYEEAYNKMISRNNKLLDEDFDEKEFLNE